MKITIVLILIFVQLLVFASGGSKCADEYAAKAEASRDKCEASHPDSPENCNRGYQTFIASIPRLCQGSNRKKRSDDNSTCVYSTKFQNTLCITDDYIYQLGVAASTPCTSYNQGQQKCAGLITSITCSLGQWTIEQLCPSGTMCLSLFGLIKNIVCGLLSPLTLLQQKI
ncbi:unnamed protein product [Adineta ricciae]|uniref:Uncharacterized protein n=1 Tax=Adineta ricciae TaxID=249248 RepID=A0A815CJ87_ADIRI|nr:unnamed protein product [Adineta ricciae]CAF1288257.1 unnamed protein product [Adineta ricciae]